MASATRKAKKIENKTINNNFDSKSVLRKLKILETKIDYANGVLERIEKYSRIISNLGDSVYKSLIDLEKISLWDLIKNIFRRRIKLNG